MRDLDRTQSQTATATFYGTRWGLFGVLLPGYILILFTLGIYRFWQVTAKRRYYWGQTSIDGDALEYSGTSMQLLVGFLIALVFFLPLYVLFFYLSTQAPEYALYGYGSAAVFLYFLAGYASFRARRFRLSRTFWRGIRFGQSGNAWAYALRRFLWTILVILTAGLAYPFMTAGLWRYRYNHTWYGDRQFSFSGSWRTIAAPFYINYFILAVLIGGAVYLASKANGSNSDAMAGILFLSFMPICVVAGLIYLHIKSRFTSRLMSSVSAGRARLQVHIRARSLLWMYLFYALMFVLVSALFAVIFGLFVGGFMRPMLEEQSLDISQIAQIGWANLVGFGLIYLALLAAYGALAETIIGLGYWRMVARGTFIEDAQDLRTVRAHGEESPVTGEGLADALNVGAY